MSKIEGKQQDTVIAHAGREPFDHFGAVNTPVYHASTILQQTVADYKRPKGLRDPRYGRRGTPTLFTLEDALTALEGGHGCVITPSGLNAVATALTTFLRPGDHMLMVDCVYGPARRFANHYLASIGVETTFFDPGIGADIVHMMRPATKVVYLEAPGSQTFEMQDVPAIARAAKRRSIKVLMDNTWATPVFFRPFDHGVDVSIHAATKYIVGHSDAMLGAVVCTEETFAPVRDTWDTFGVSPGPDDVYLGTRGLRTIAVRLRRHQETALTLATWLQGRPEVERVLYPALPDDPGHAIWKRDFLGASGLFAVILKPCSDAAVAAMLDGLELYGMGASWGGFESLILPSDPTSNRTATKWAPEGPLLRIHAGLESPDDLIADLEAGFERLKATG